MEETTPADLDFNGVVRQRTFISYIIWVAFTVSAFIYGGVCFLIVDTQVSDGSLDVILLTAFIAVAIVASLVALTINKKFGDPDTILKRLASPKAGNEITKIREKHPKLSQKEACQVHLLGLLFLKTILCMALLESVLLLGFFLAIQEHNVAYYFYFAAPAFILQLSICPRPQSFLRVCNEVMRAATERLQEPADETLEGED